MDIDSIGPLQFFEDLYGNYYMWDRGMNEVSHLLYVNPSGPTWGKPRPCSEPKGSWAQLSSADMTLKIESVMDGTAIVCGVNNCNSYKCPRFQDTQSIGGH